VQVVLGDVVDDGSSGVDLAESELVMIARIQNVHQVGEEGMDVLK